MTGTTLTIIIIIGLLVIAALAVVGYRAARRKRTERLREQFGPEYDHAVERSGDRNAAESELRQRAKRRERIELKELDPHERADFERRWTEVKGAFVDDPSKAVRDADRLVIVIMKARGYPVEQFDQGADDLSVDHPEVTQRYREAKKIAKANEAGSADTEELRQAVTSYRPLVEALLHGQGDGDGGDRDRGGDRERPGAERATPADRNGQQTEHASEAGRTR